VSATPPSIDFLSRLKRIDNHDLKGRDILVLWGIARENGVMGQEIAHKLGYKERSNIQHSINRLLRHGLIEDRRPAINHMTPNELYVTPAGTELLTEIVPV
jgi:DNA-binding MarR family transcriptional regulator